MLIDELNKFRHWLKDEEINDLRHNLIGEADVIRDVREEFEKRFADNLDLEKESNK